MSDHASIPVTILTGFLGAGKTSFLNRILRCPKLEGAMVLINEFGAVGIDHLLVEAGDDTIIELSNGCLCCTIRSNLIDRLEDLLTRIGNGCLRKISRLIIETTGLADPVPILQIFMTHPLLLREFRYDGMITVVDGVNGSKTLAYHEEARRQVGLADRIVVTKNDLLGKEKAIDALLARLKSLNNAADIYINDINQEIDSALLQCDMYQLDLKRLSSKCGTRFLDKNSGKNKDLELFVASRETKTDPDNATTFLPDHQEHHHHDVNHHNNAIQSFCLCYDKPLSIGVIEAFLEWLDRKYGANILRIKGIVETWEQRDKPLIIHGAQGLFHPPQWLQDWGSQAHQTRLVIIAEHVCALEVEEFFATFTGQIGIDRADFQSVNDNPLAIAGLKF